LGLHLYSLDIPAQKARSGEYPLNISISANGENIISGEELIGGGGWSSDGRNYVTYGYVCNDFPDVNEFDLILDNLGVQKHIVLTQQSDNFALSNEINGITLAVGKFGGVTDMIATDVFDSAESANDYYIFGNIFFESKYYGKYGGQIQATGGWGGYDSESPLNYQIIEFYKNEKEIKKVKATMIFINYQRKEPLAFEIPVPKDGETIKTNIEIPVGSHIFRITEVRREGDKIYYEKNSHDVFNEDGSTTIKGVPYPWNDGYKDGESYIESPYIGDIFDKDRDIEKYNASPKMSCGEIWDFDENAETITFRFSGARVVQFGNFDVEFD